MTVCRVSSGVGLLAIKHAPMQYKYTRKRCSNQTREDTRAGRCQNFEWRSGWCCHADERTAGAHATPLWRLETSTEAHISGTGIVTHDAPLQLFQNATLTETSCELSMRDGEVNASPTYQSDSLPDTETFPLFPSLSMTPQRRKTFAPRSCKQSQQQEQHEQLQQSETWHTICARANSTCCSDLDPTLGPLLFGWVAQAGEILTRVQLTPFTLEN